MKRLPGKFFILFIFLIGMCNGYAGDSIEEGPPEPPASLDATPPPPPGLSINENIYILFSVALLFGIYIIYKNNLKVKSPI